ncbi:hypothetical protein HPP92_009133 [Vanilla planifolia]|uniref:WD and tetratricopeptide repeats protein 1 n=1 Tax=Vanilla planifolia TaxID=51239 RepID=A0A835RIQ2_VANPL|nr:hypothetical protein HPP92_009133 [Vanilla planifolia]
MESWNFPDGNVGNLLERRCINPVQDMNHHLQMHSSLVQRLTLDEVMEGHLGCVNAISWNSTGSLLISGSDDTRVRLFNLSGSAGKRGEICTMEPSALFQCHSSRVKKLAVEVGNPNIVWSASEDGTLRQHDLRECSTCPPAGSSNQECRNVLLDLRSGAKKSLFDPAKLHLSLKSCDISATRPHQILVGGSDAFARLYDRRMLPPLSSCQTKAKPPPCVCYFCPMHLSERRRSSLHLTHVTFSPNGDELLLSYSGEHAYLMDVNHGGQTISSYSVSDVSKLSPIIDCGNTDLPPQIGSSVQFTGSKRHLRRLDACKRLMLAAAKTLEEGWDVCHGIEMCNEVLHGKGPAVDPSLQHECLCIRAALLLKRKWKNDVHMAIRDCKDAHRINPCSFRAYYYMSEALLQLRKHKEALEYALVAHKSDPSNSEGAEQVASIRKLIAAAEAEKKRKDGEDSSQEICPMEVSGDEIHNNESNILRGSLNFRFHRRGDSNEENVSNGLHVSLPSSIRHENCYEPEGAIDMKQRYVGHCNVGTDIKQASFLGRQGDFVASGSDDGRWFIWEKRTGRLVKVLLGDEAVVNCVQCHPSDCAVATSGIDNTIKMWNPQGETPCVRTGAAEPDMVLSILESNQRKLLRNREALFGPELGYCWALEEFSSWIIMIHHPQTRASSALNEINWGQLMPSRRQPCNNSASKSSSIIFYNGMHQLKNWRQVLHKHSFDDLGKVGEGRGKQQARYIIRVYGGWERKTPHQMQLATNEFKR